MKLTCQIIVLVLFILHCLDSMRTSGNTWRGSCYALALILIVAFLYWQSGTFSEIIRLLE